MQLKAKQCRGMAQRDKTAITRDGCNVTEHRGALVRRSSARRARKVDTKVSGPKTTSRIDGHNPWKLRRMQSWKVSERGFQWTSQAIEGLSSLDSRINSLELISKRKAWLIEACAAENRGGLGASRLRKGTCRLHIAQDEIAMAELGW